jgi:SAM-dependent methyltransferase
MMYPSQAFARLLARTLERAEEKGNAEHRRETLAGIRGRVIEVGAGIGTNFRHYPPGVEEVVASEPDPYLRGRAEEAAAEAPVRVTVSAGAAEDLPFPDAAFDVGVASLVLCSVRDPERVLRELFRVIRPGGELRYYEHVRSNRPGFAAMQRTLDRAGVPRLIGNDHCARKTDHLIREAGFAVEEERRFPFRPAAIAFPMTPHVLGRARRPAG